MTVGYRPRVSSVLSWVVAAVLVWGSAPVAANAADFSVDFAAGDACTFGLRIEGRGGNQVIKEFHDENGNLVRSIGAGTGSALTFTNLDTGAAVSTRSNGAGSHVTYNPDGSSKWINTGHNVLILFPSDVPAGPSTTLYVGRVVFTVEGSGTFTLLGHSGTATDICAALL